MRSSFYNKIFSVDFRGLSFCSCFSGFPVLSLCCGTPSAGSAGGAAAGQPPSYFSRTVFGGLSGAW